jgi:hypothetical protein
MEGSEGVAAEEEWRGRRRRQLETGKERYGDGRKVGVARCECDAAVGDRLFFLREANTVRKANGPMPLSFCNALLELVLDY